MRSCGTSAILGILRQLIGPAIRFDTSKLNMKAPGYGAAVEWHQDWAFYPHTNSDLCAVGVMMDDCGIENGPLLCIPGSHKGPVHDHHATARSAARSILSRAGSISARRCLHRNGRQHLDPPRAHDPRLGGQHLGKAPAPAALPVRGRRCLAPRRRCAAEGLGGVERPDPLWRIRSRSCLAWKRCRFGCHCRGRALQGRSTRRSATRRTAISARPRR